MGCRQLKKESFITSKMTTKFIAHAFCIHERDRGEGKGRNRESVLRRIFTLFMWK
jgi:hypothetical protein